MHASIAENATRGVQEMSCRVLTGATSCPEVAMRTRSRTATGIGSPPVQAVIYVIPGSHPSMAGRLMLEHKGIDYRRRDLVAGLSRPILRAAGFPGVTVPAIKLDGRKLQGTREISRELDALAPEPPLFPADPDRPRAVGEAEAWGDEQLQPVPRRLAWAAFSRDRTGVGSFLEGARLGIPAGLAARTSAPVVAPCHAPECRNRGGRPGRPVRA